MPSFTGNYHPNVGPLVSVAVLRLDATQSVDGKPPVIQGEKIEFFQALIDTGASSTCLSSRVVDAVGLQPTGKAMMQGATGASAVNQYSFLVGFVQNSTQRPDGSFDGMLTQMAVQGMEFDGGGSTFDVLLGRDILCRGVFTMSFDGHYAFSF